LYFFLLPCRAGRRRKKNGRAFGRGGREDIYDVLFHLGMERKKKRRGKKRGDFLLSANKRGKGNRNIGGEGKGRR